jgi:hypothetical protein
MAAVGLVGTLLGLAGGRAVMAWVTGTQLQRTMPGIGVEAYLAPGTLVTAAVHRVVAVAAALCCSPARPGDGHPATLRVLE